MLNWGVWCCMSGGEGFIWCVLYEEEGGVEMLIGWIAREDWRATTSSPP